MNICFIENEKSTLRNSALVNAEELLLLLVLARRKVRASGSLMRLIYQKG